MMVVLLIRNWWTLAWRGLIAVLFGVAAFVWPGLTLTALTMLFGAFALLDGALALAATLIGRPRGTYWSALMAEGALGLAVGILALFWPIPMAIALIYLIAAWALVTGILEIVAALQLRKEVNGEWLLVIVGILSVVFSVVAFAWPRPTLTVLTMLFGAYALFFGALLLALALRLRTWGQQFPSLGV